MALDKRFMNDRDLWEMVISGDIAVLGADCHYITNKLGSKNEFSD